MDRVVANALKRRSELRSELAEIERFLALYEHFKGAADERQQTLPTHFHAAKEQSGEEAETHGEHPVGSVPTVSSPARSITRHELEPIIADLIREAGQPLSRGQILRKLDSRGVPVGGEADRSKNMGTIMWRLRETFVNLSGRGYWLRDTPLEEAGYDPQDQNSPEAIDHVLREEESAQH